MSNHQDAPATSPTKIENQYPLGGVFIATLVGSPLATAYLFRQNLIWLDQKKLAAISTLLFIVLGIGSQFYRSPPDMLSQLFMYAGPLYILIHLYTHFLRRVAPEFASPQRGTKLKQYAKAIAIGIALNLLITGLSYRVLGFITLFSNMSR